MKITIEEHDKQKAKLLMANDDAFTLLWEIDQYCRSQIKYAEKKDVDEILDTIRGMIWEDNILDLWE